MTESILQKAHSHNKGLHHAYLLEGNQEFLINEVLLFTEKQLKIATRGNPDFFQTNYDVFGIDDSRALKEMQSRRSLSDTLKIFLISAHSMTREAQNSLLKVFEEPAPNTHFFLIVPTAEILIPTLRSRFFMIRGGRGQNGKADKIKRFVESFLESRPPKRLSLLKKMLENKEKSEALAFLNVLEEILYLKYKKKYNTETTRVFENIIKCRSYLNDRSPGVKMILEHLALTTLVI